MGRILDAVCRSSRANNKKLFVLYQHWHQSNIWNYFQGPCKGPWGTPLAHDADDAVLSKEFVTHTQDVIYNIK